MSTPPLTIEDLNMSLDELRGLIKLEESRDSSVFGTEEDDHFILIIARMIKRHEESIKSLQDIPGYQVPQGTEYNMWETVCNAATRLLGNYVSQDQMRIRLIKERIQEDKTYVRTVTQVRKANATIFSLALCGVFRTESQESYFSLNNYYREACMDSREAIQKRAERLYDACKTAALMIDFPEMKGNNRLAGSEVFSKSLIRDMSKLMDETIELFLTIPDEASLDKLIDRVVRTNERMYRHLATPIFPESIQSIGQERQTLRSMVNECTELLNNITEYLPDSSDDEERLAQTHDLATERNDEVLQEVRIWNCLTTPGWSTALSGSAPTRDFLRLSAQALTYSNISIKMSQALKIDVKLWGQPKDENVFDVRVGGFARVYEIALDDYMLVSIPTSRYKRVSSPRPIRVSKIAVKVIKAVMHMPANQLYTKENATCARIIREMRIWSKMKHDNIIPLLGLWIDFFEEGTRVRYPAAISSWMDNGDLHDYLHDNQHIPLKDRLYMMRDIADALAYMHSQEHVVVHGDLKANNVLVDKGKVYLSDFGLSKMKDGVTGQSSAVHANIRWAAPELFKLRRECKASPTCETDMFSFGSVFLEVLTGDYPWPSLGDYDVQQLRNERITRFPDRPDSISKDSPYWQMMRKCWRVEPVLRPTSSQALGAIEDCIQKLC